MRLLLDTHAVIWWLEESDRLGSAARNAIEDGDNEVFAAYDVPILTASP